MPPVPLVSVPDISPARPKPHTTRALLMSAGYRKPTPTVHFFHETREVTLRGANGGPAWEFIFRCFKTGAERRYGVEHRTEPGVRHISPVEDDDVEADVIDSGTPPAEGN